MEAFEMPGSEFTDDDHYVIDPKTIKSTAHKLVSGVNSSTP